MYQQELEVAKTLAEEAADIVLKFYSGEVAVSYKEDESPVTQADIAADKHICEGLQREFPQDAILSEERESIDISTQKRVWVIDPLDGTKEFIKKNGEFTINIALLDNGRPVVGVISVPAKDDLYWAAKGYGSFRNAEKIAASQREKNLILVHSRSHVSDQVKHIMQKHPFAETIPAGSSVKGCLVGQGAADVYIRFGIKEWDICAMHCIIEQSGAVMTGLKGDVLAYGNPDHRIEGFVCSNPAVHEKILRYVSEEHNG